MSAIFYFPATKRLFSKWLSISILNTLILVFSKKKTRLETCPFGVWLSINYTAMYFMDVTSEVVGMHVLMCPPLFRISGSAGRIMQKFGVLLVPLTMRFTQDISGGYLQVRKCNRTSFFSTLVHLFASARLSSKRVLLVLLICISFSDIIKDRFSKTFFPQIITRLTFENLRGQLDVHYGVSIRCVWRSRRDQKRQRLLVAFGSARLPSVLSWYCQV